MVGWILIGITTLVAFFPRKYGQLYGTFTYLHVLDPEIPIDILCLPGDFPTSLAVFVAKVRFSSI